MIRLLDGCVGGRFGKKGALAVIVFQARTLKISRWCAGALV